MPKNHYAAALDIGSSKVALAVGTMAGAGIPLAPDGGKRFNKKRIPGVPSLIEEDIRRLKELEEETAYTRRYKLLLNT